jgi:peptidoglycan biosynthesis protein MviN/MurJ (putative lipid II flippase)
MLMSAVFEIVLVSRKRYVAAAWTYGVSDVVRTVALVAPAVMLGTVDGVLLGAVLFAGLRVIAMLVALWREFGRDFRVDFHLWRYQLAYALPFALAVGVEVLQIYFHQYFVASRFDAATFAIYAVGCLQLPLLDLITSSIGNVMMVKMGEDESHGDRRAALTLWHDSVVRQALLLFPLMVILIVAAREIIVVLYTATFLASVPIFMLWSLTILPSVLAVDPVLRVFAQTRFLLFMNIVRVVLVASLIGWCLSAFGLYGAVLVTLLSSCVVKGIGLVRIARLMHVRLVDVLPWHRLAVIAVGAVAAASPAYWILRHVAMAPIVGMFAATGLYGATYVALCIAYVRLREPALGRLRPASTEV